MHEWDLPDFQEDDEDHEDESGFLPSSVFERPTNEDSSQLDSILFASTSPNVNRKRTATAMINQTNKRRKLSESSDDENSSNHDHAHDESIIDKPLSNVNYQTYSQKETNFHGNFRGVINDVATAYINSNQLPKGPCSHCDSGLNISHRCIDCPSHRWMCEGCYAQHFETSFGHRVGK